MQRSDTLYLSDTNILSAVFELDDVALPANTTTNVSHAANESVERLFTPFGSSVANRNATEWHGDGWAIPVADAQPDEPTGLAVIHEQNVTVQLKLKSLKSNVVAVGDNTFLPRVSLWRWKTDGTHSLIVSASSTVVIVPETDVLTSVVLSVPRTILQPDETLFLQIGGAINAPQPVIGDNTSTYTLTVDSTSTVAFETGLRTFFTRALQGVTIASAERGGLRVAKHLDAPVIASAGLVRALTASRAFTSQAEVQSDMQRSVIYTRAFESVAVGRFRANDLFLKLPASGLPDNDTPRNIIKRPVYVFDD